MARASPRAVGSQTELIGCATAFDRSARSRDGRREHTPGRSSRVNGALLALVLPVWLPGCSHASSTPPLLLATTTSVVNSGLTERLLPLYEQQTGVRAKVIPVGSGRALKLLADGHADAAVTHAPVQETAAMRAHSQWVYRKILYNDFVIVGPREDVAAVAHARDAVDAMRRIAASPARFISRGDESGTHERERQLWESAGVQPQKGRIVVAGAGMGDTLRIASETESYTLSDRATFEQLASHVALTVLSSGDPVLLNTYAVVADPSDPAGIRFARWLSGEAGREAIADLVGRGQLRGFTLWPTDRRGDRPMDRPF
jgi:tungstate transport system substrate-binding protein